MAIEAGAFQIRSAGDRQWQRRCGRAPLCLDDGRDNDSGSGRECGGAVGGCEGSRTSVGDGMTATVAMFVRRNLLGDVGVESSSFLGDYLGENCPAPGTGDGDTLGVVTSLEVSFEGPFPLISNLDDLSSYAGAFGMAMLAGLRRGEWMHPSLSPSPSPT
uniref:Uncharacterized protein n=1 Tax=Oryza glaberrima TaxID=4538 RepID=I1PSU4_ORYGL